MFYKDGIVQVLFWIVPVLFVAILAFVAPKIMGQKTVATEKQDSQNQKVETK